MRYLFTVSALFIALMITAQPDIEESTANKIETVTKAFEDEADWTLKGIITENTSTLTTFRLITVDTKEVYLSTTFNPNNELNASFKVEGKDVRVMEMNIFDQWGELVHHSKLKNEWNGEISKDEKAKPGTYIYAIKAKISPYKTTKLSGCVIIE